MKKYLVSLFVLSFTCLVGLAWAGVLPESWKESYRMEPFMRNLTNPQEIALAPDGRVFYLERTTGNVRIIQNGKLLSSSFIHVDVATGPEEGLLGIALHPNFASNGYVYIFYTQASPLTNRIVRYKAEGNVGTGATVILDNIGSAPGGTNVGGGLAFGNDGKLYAAIGDMEDSTQAQLLTSFKGKILRMNDDGSVPTDNPFYIGGGNPDPGQLTYSFGFRNANDIAVNKNVGTIYGTDSYDTADTCDEVNVITSGTNYGWDVESCSGGAYQAPLHAINPQLDVTGLSPYTGSKYPGMQNNLFVAGDMDGKIIRDVLTGAAYDSYSSSSAFYDPTAEASCPAMIEDIAEGADGWLYAVSNDSTPADAGIYRIIRDSTGTPTDQPREVSASPYVQLTVAKDGSGLRFWWEDLKKDVWGCSGDSDGTNHCPAGSKNTKYTLWQGTLNMPFTYTHTALAQTDGDGTSQNDALRSYGIASMPTGNVYYLVSGRGSNREGTTGFRTGSIERPGWTNIEICDSVGWSAQYHKCSPNWPASTPPTLCSPNEQGYPDQYNKCHRLHEWRGKAVLIGFEQFG